MAILLQSDVCGKVSTFISLFLTDVHLAILVSTVMTVRYYYYNVYCFLILHQYIDQLVYCAKLLSLHVYLCLMTFVSLRSLFVSSSGGGVCVRGTSAHCNSGCSHLHLCEVSVYERSG